MVRLREARQVLEADARRLAPGSRPGSPAAVACEPPDASLVAAIRAQLEPISTIDGLAASFAREAGYEEAVGVPSSPLRAAYARRLLDLKSRSASASRRRA